jgi:hypothetical protein
MYNHNKPLSNTNTEKTVKNAAPSFKAVMCVLHFSVQTLKLHTYNFTVALRTISQIKEHRYLFK